MKTQSILILGLLVAGSIGITANAQTSINPSLDVYSNYMWRGCKFGTGPAFQPSVNLKNGGLTIGVWGSYDVSGYSEADLFASYAFQFGLSITGTDYYYPSIKNQQQSYVPQKYFDMSSDTTAHAFELGIGYTLGKLSASANYIFNKTTGAGTMGGDKYFEVSYAFSNASVFVGAGDGWHTSNTKFAVCNIGLKSTKEIKVTDSFSIPVTGMIILNPEREQFNLVVGFTF
jgi:hypothetical protein